MKRLKGTSAICTEHEKKGSIEQMLPRKEISVCYAIEREDVNN
jgi:hypothetical protein